MAQPLWIVLCVDYSMDTAHLGQSIRTKVNL